MKSPSLTTMLNGKNKTLYMPVSSSGFMQSNYFHFLQTLDAMKKVTEVNLSKTLSGNDYDNLMYSCLQLLMFSELGLEDGHEVIVADVTTPKPVTFSIKFIYNME